MSCLYIVIPAYNEEVNLRSVIDDWYPIIEKHNENGTSRLVIVNDGSSDGTYNILEEEAESRPLLVPLHKVNGGHGSAIYCGYKYALKMGADYIFQTDSDGQTLPSEFEAFWRQRERFDMVIGRRSGRDDGASRVFVTKVLRLVLLASFQTWISDANTPYRLMKAEPLKDALEYIDAKEPLTNVMVSAVFTKKHRKILYRQITFRARQGGVNSINIPKIAKIGTDALSRFIKLNARL